MLRFPAEPPDPALARASIGDDRRPPAHAVAVAVAGILQRQQRVIVDGFDEPGSEERQGTRRMM